eukprot:6912456-Alexandrium_andersonii.AAC.1
MSRCECGSVIGTEKLDSGTLVCSHLSPQMSRNPDVLWFIQEPNHEHGGTGQKSQGHGPLHMGDELEPVA